jgi:phosphoribosylformylglycinamidine synthase
MVGLIENLAQVTRAVFRDPGDEIVLLGENTDELGGSEYLKWIHDVVAGYPPGCDLPAERRLIEAVLEAISQGCVSSAHDTSEGGLAVALAECCVMQRDRVLGALVDLSAWEHLSRRALLFGEAQGRVVLSTARAEAVLAVAERHGVPARVIGRVGDPGGEFTLRIGGREWRIPLARLADAYHSAIPSLMARIATAADDSEPMMASS